MGIRERKERERHQRRSVILDSARAAFIKYGLLTTSMERIAKEAELAKGTLYLYFANKAELLMALIASDVDQLNVRLQAVIALDIPADAKLIRAFSEFEEFSQVNPFFFQVMTQLNVAEMLTGQLNTDTHNEFAQSNRRLIGLVESILQEGIETGVFAPQQSVQETVAQLIVAVKGSIVVLRNHMVPPMWVQNSEKQFLHQLVRLLVRGISTPERQNILREAS